MLEGSKKELQQHEWNSKYNGHLLLYTSTWNRPGPVRSFCQESAGYGRAEPSRLARYNLAIIKPEAFYSKNIFIINFAMGIKRHLFLGSL